ncbi:ROK family protein [Streptantibioticus cattleyicolor]|uniref:Sugar kinase n=1 Tax=Streptantibioticus cattleyicolor (strain ATCC 35852 / DSM 46488 / JCM 4925 / NBRC 14057 / NRRL 8057) TaxID=1003195 RepID=F8JKC7_STREN|nr:ROK family protein [Streptantibioticus cattleyicolor]AEW98509.1 sugar kinase [Streptantibioticus cattleyicolor NRRL 8057 = DSM 46488]CCB72433.1 putative sugar kinase [Streptantibioticus cattleyicolor NRRL 8057 = DSM 46488]
MTRPLTHPTVVAGVDIGGTTTQVVLCTPDLAVVAHTQIPTPAAQGGPAMIRAALDALRRLLGQSPRRLAGVGVGAAGVVDTATGRVLVASDSFRDWAGFPVTATIEAELGVPAFLDNDVNAFLRGEVAKGAVQGERDVLGITLGTGVGGALCLGGTLLDGAHGAAGEIGHIPGFGDLPCTCGGRGHLETLASGRAVATHYARRTGHRTTARHIAAAAENGDADARAVFHAAGTAVARAVLITAGLLDVTTVVLGGGLTHAWHLLHPAIRQALEAEPPVSAQPIRLERTRLAGHAAAIGAACLAGPRPAPVGA